MEYVLDKQKAATLLPRVMRAAVQLFVRRGVEATTIKEIASAAGVSTGALYNHFKGKEDLAWHLFSTHLHVFTQELSDRVGAEPDVPRKIQAYVAACFEAFEENRDLFTYLIIAEYREFKKYPKDLPHPGTIAQRLVEEGQKAGAIKPGDSAVLGALLFGPVIRLCAARMYGGLQTDLLAQTPLVADSLWKSLRT